ncbi:MAG: Ig-like domain-containing protein [Candidatus Sericytochromatia bacterium]
MKNKKQMKSVTLSLVVVALLASCSGSFTLGGGGGDPLPPVKDPANLVKDPNRPDQLPPSPVPVPPRPNPIVAQGCNSTGIKSAASFTTMGAPNYRILADVGGYEACLKAYEGNLSDQFSSQSQYYKDITESEGSSVAAQIAVVDTFCNETIDESTTFQNENVNTNVNNNVNENVNTAVITPVGAVNHNENTNTNNNTNTNTNRLSLDFKDIHTKNCGNYSRNESTASKKERYSKFSQSEATAISSRVGNPASQKNFNDCIATIKGGIGFESSVKEDTSTGEITFKVKWKADFGVNSAKIVSFLASGAQVAQEKLILANCTDITTAETTQVLTRMTKNAITLILQTDRGSVVEKLPANANFKLPEMDLSSTSETLNPTETRQLTATVKFATGTSSNRVSWVSSNPQVVSVDEKGMVTALKLGQANIFATFVDNLMVSKTIAVSVGEVSAANTAALNAQKALESALKATTPQEALVFAEQAKTAAEAANKAAFDAKLASDAAPEDKILLNTATTSQTWADKANKSATDAKAAIEKLIAEIAAYSTQLGGVRDGLTNLASSVRGKIEPNYKQNPRDHARDIVDYLNSLGSTVDSLANTLSAANATVAGAPWNKTTAFSLNGASYRATIADIKVALDNASNEDDIREKETRFLNRVSGDFTNSASSISAIIAALPKP